MGIAAILSLIAFALTDRARTVTSLLANHIAAAEAEALADAAVHHAVLTLMHGPEGQEFVPRPPRSYLLELGSGGVEVAVSDEDGKIDLTAAPPVLIANLFQGVGTSSEAAAAVVAAIVARREPEAGPGFPDASDDLARPSAIFPTLGALQGVEGMDEGLYRRVRPYLTVFGQGEGVDPRAA
ncbi:MAG TPA: hypothetical protein VFG43_16520, partial [Geminicoccaceae bacterium]|nr:hypothetical protein [Geminicoccaceae bacterium]